MRNLRKCFRCGYKWFQRGKTKPQTCPKCRTRYWDKKRKIKKKK